MPDWTTSLISWVGLGGGAGGSFFMVRWFLEWLGIRYDKRAALLDVGTEKLIRHLEEQYNRVLERLSVVEEELRKCKERDAKSQEEISRLRGLIQGRGEARQVAQLIIAEDKRK